MQDEILLFLVSSFFKTWFNNSKSLLKYHYLLGKGGYVFGSVGLSVCLFVCLSVNNITQKVMNGLG